MPGIQIDSIFIKITGDAGQYMEALDQAKKATKQFSSAVAAPLMAMGLPLAYVGKLGVDAFAKFDQAMTESISIMDATDNQIQRMKQTALDLSTSTKFRPEQLAKAYYHLASSGMNAEQAIAALPAVAKFATAGAFDLEKATQLASTAQSAIGLRAGEAGTNLASLTRIMDVLVKANNLAEGNVRDFSIALSRQAAAAARNYGKSLEETVAVLMVMGQQNIKAQVAGTNYSMILRHMTKQSIKNRKEQEALGLSVFDGNGNLKNFADIAENLEQVLGKMSPELRAAALLAMGFDARIQQAIFPLIGFSKQIRNFEAQLKGAGGTMDVVANKQMSSFTNQMLMAKNAILVAGISVGEILAPGILTLAMGIKDVVSWFTQLPDVTKGAIVGILAMTAATMLFVGAIIIAGKVFNLMFGGIGIVAGLFVAAVVTTGATLGMMVVAAGGFGTVIETIKEKLNQFWTWIKPVREAFSELMKAVGEATYNMFKYLYDTAVQTWNKLMGDSNTTWNDIRDAVGNAMLFAEYTLKNFQQVAELVWVGIKLYAIQALRFMTENYFRYFTGPGGMISLFSLLFKSFQTQQGGMIKVAARAAGQIGSIWIKLFNVRKLLDQGQQDPAQQLVNDIMKTKQKRVEIDITKGIKFTRLEEMEQQLQEEFDKIKDKVKIGFEEFKDRRFKGRQTLLIEQNMGPFRQLDDLSDKNKKVTDDITDQWKAAAQNGLGRFEAAAYRTAESITRFEEYRAGLLGRAGGRVRHGMAKGVQQPADVGGNIIKKNKLPQIVPGKRKPDDLPPAPNDNVLPPPMMEPNNGKQMVNLLEEVRDNLVLIRNRRVQVDLDAEEADFV